MFLFLRKMKAYSNKGSKATGCSKKKMAVIVFEMFLPFPAKRCVDSCAIQAWPSPLPVSWHCVHFSCVWDSRSLNKGAWRQRLPLGCKHPSVSGVWKQPSSPWECFLDINLQQESIWYATEQGRLKVQTLLYHSLAGQCRQVT